MGVTVDAPDAPLKAEAAPHPPQVSRGTRIAFVLAALTLSTLLMVGALLGLDLALHRRFDSVAGVNIRGYRGPVAGAKQPGEQRIVVLGGSTALGYGVLPNEAFPARLEAMLNAWRQQEHRPPVSVVNIAYNSEGAYAFLHNLRFYENLHYDTALLYTGYNDLSAPNTYVFRDQPIFRLTGYMPIFPIIFREKAMALRYNGNIDAGYRQDKTVFRPNLAERTTASALETAVRVSDSLDRQLGRLTAIPEAAEAESTGCSERWTFYCGRVLVAVRHVVDRGRRAIVVTQPYIADDHAEQQQQLHAMLRQTFRGDPRVMVADLGTLIDLKDRSLAYDGMHLTAEGNQRVADALLPVLHEALQP